MSTTIHRMTLKHILRNLHGTNILEVTCHNSGFMEDIQQLSITTVNDFCGGDQWDTLILHMLERDMIQRVLKTAHSGTAGRILILQHNSWSPDFWRHRQTYKNILSKSHLIKLCAQQGFTVTTVDHVVIVPNLFRRLKFLRAIEKYVFEIPENILRHTPLRVFSRNLIAVIDIDYE